MSIGGSDSREDNYGGSSSNPAIPITARFGNVSMRRTHGAISALNPQYSSNNYGGPITNRPQAHNNNLYASSVVPPFLLNNDEGSLSHVASVANYIWNNNTQISMLEFRRQHSPSAHATRIQPARTLNGHRVTNGAPIMHPLNQQGPNNPNLQWQQPQVQPPHGFMGNAQFQQAMHSEVGANSSNLLVGSSNQTQQGNTRRVHRHYRQQLRQGLLQYLYPRCLERLEEVARQARAPSLQQRIGLQYLYCQHLQRENEALRSVRMRMGMHGTTQPSIQIRRTLGPNNLPPSLELQLGISSNSTAGQGNKEINQGYNNGV